MVKMKTEKPAWDNPLVRAIGLWLGSFLVMAGLLRVVGKIESGTEFFAYQSFFCGFLSFAVGVTVTLYLIRILMRQQLGLEYTIFGLLVAGVTLVIPITNKANLVQIMFVDSMAVIVTAAVGILIAMAITRVGYIIPLLVAAMAVDIFSVFWGPTAQIQARPQLLSHFLFHYPVLGTGVYGGIIGINDFVFAAFLLRVGGRYKLSEKRIFIGLVLALLVGFVATWVTPKYGLPLLPFLAGFFIIGHWRQLIADRENLKQAAIAFRTCQAVPEGLGNPICREVWGLRCFQGAQVLRNTNKGLGINQSLRP